LNDIRDMKVAQRPLKACAFLSGRSEQSFNQSDKVSPRKWLFEIVDRAQPAGLFAFNREMGRSENNRPRFRMTCPKGTDEILSVLRGGIESEDKQLRLLVAHRLLGFA